MPTDHTKAVGWTRSALRFAVPDSAARSALLDRVGVRPEAFAHPENRISIELDHAVWREVERIAGRQIGLTLADQSMSPSSVGLLGFLTMSAGTVAEALQLSVRYHALLEDLPSARLELGPDTIAVVFEPTVEPIVEAAIDAALAGYVALLRSWTQSSISPISAEFRSPAPVDAERYPRWFGCPTGFDAPRNAVTFSAQTGRVPLVTSNPELLSYLEMLAQERLGHPLERDELPRRIRDELQRRFGHEPLELIEVARSLGFSSRTLQRRLKELDLSFAQLVDEVRFRRASTLLVETELSIGEIAFTLGFRDGRGFRRAFRRWAGLSPQAYRSARPA